MRLVSKILKKKVNTFLNIEVLTIKESPIYYKNVHLGVNLTIGDLKEHSSMFKSKYSIWF